MGGVRTEAWSRRGTSASGDLHGGRERRLARRAAPALAAGPLPVQASVVRLHDAAQGHALVALLVTCRSLRSPSRRYSG